MAIFNIFKHFMTFLWSVVWKTVATSSFQMQPHLKMAKYQTILWMRKSQFQIQHLKKRVIWRPNCIMTLMVPKIMVACSQMDAGLLGTISSSNSLFLSHQYVHSLSKFATFNSIKHDLTCMENSTGKLESRFKIGKYSVVNISIWFWFLQFFHEKRRS